MPSNLDYEWALWAQRAIPALRREAEGPVRDLDREARLDSEYERSANAFHLAVELGLDPEQVGEADKISHNSLVSAMVEGRFESHMVRMQRDRARVQAARSREVSARHQAACLVGAGELDRLAAGVIGEAGLWTELGEVARVKLGEPLPNRRQRKPRHRKGSR